VNLAGIEKDNNKKTTKGEKRQNKCAKITALLSPRILKWIDMDHRLSKNYLNYF
jgi:hypothetical protein